MTHQDKLPQANQHNTSEDASAASERNSTQNVSLPDFKYTPEEPPRDKRDVNRSRTEGTRGYDEPESTRTGRLGGSDDLNRRR